MGAYERKEDHIKEKESSDVRSGKNQFRAGFAAPQLCERWSK